MKDALLSALIILTSIAWPSALSGDTVDINSGREVVSQWVKTRTLISQIKRDWVDEKDLLQSAIELNKAELEKTDKKFSELEKQNTNLKVEFSERDIYKKDLDSIEAKLTTRIQKTEASLLALVDRLPEPLHEKIQPLVEKLPKEDASISVSIRLQTVVGLMSEIEKWDSSITLDSQSYSSKEGSSVLIDVIYIGLGQGYFANNDEANPVAGVIMPSENGWIFEEQNSLAEKIRKLVRVYKGQPAEYVNIPLKIH